MYSNKYFYIFPLIYLNSISGWTLNDTRCNLVRWMESDILREFGTEGLPPLHHEPLIIIRDSPSYVDFSERASMENITNQFPRNFQITLSSSNSFSANRRTISLEQVRKSDAKLEMY